MEHQQLQILPLRLPQQHAHRLIRLVEGGHRQFIADDGLQGRHLIDRIRQLLHPGLGHADHVDARPAGGRGGQVHIIHGELQHGLVDVILDRPGQGAGHFGIGHRRLVDLDLLIKAGREGDSHLRLGEAVAAEQLAHGLGPLLRAVDGAGGEDGWVAERSQHDPIAGQQESHLSARGRTSEKLFH